MVQVMKKLFKEEKGQAMTEYGLILGLIALVVIVLLTTMGTTIKAKFQAIVDGLTGTTTTPPAEG